MLKMRSLKLEASPVMVGLLVVSACSLPPPARGSRDGGGMGTEMCLDEIEADGGAGGAGGADSGGMSDGSGMGTGGEMGTGGGMGAGGMSGGGGGAAGMSGGGNVDTTIPAVACSGDNARGIEFKYAPGYTPDPAIVSRVQRELSTMSLQDEILQMYGRYITAFTASYSNIQRSEDTKTIRGFRYRDASRGMNLGEDMNGVYPKAGMSGASFVGYSTAFPVSMARGAAFDLDLEHDIGQAIGDEMQAAKETLLLAPCMNLLRHPLWGRAQETYGEDPYHMGRLATAMTVGIQKHVPANAKHFMAYNVENLRSTNDSSLDEQTLRETFGRHFRMVVQDGGVASVMAAYNQINGVKATQSKHLLTDVLRDDFGFKGFVLSDWWAMPNTDPKTDPTILKRTAIEAVQAGLDVELPWGLNFGQLENLINRGLTKADIDRAVARILEQKFRFNADNLDGNVGIGMNRTRYRNHRIMCDAKHLALAEKAAIESMVLLKNRDVLPIRREVKKVAVVGAVVPYRVTDGATPLSTKNINFATDVVTGDLGSSRVFHDPMKGVGPFDGIKATAPADVTVVSGNSAQDAADADFVVVMAGLTPGDEGEEYTRANDRRRLELDGKFQDDPQFAAYVNIQNKLISDVAALGKPMVVVLQGGSVIAMPWLESVPAVVMAFYAGQRGGEALGKLLWGSYQGSSYSFSGKLPFTWGRSLDDYLDFDVKPTTPHSYYVGYTYFEKENITPVFHFGHGLSYTTFAYRRLQLGCSEMSKGAVMPVVVNVANTGSVAGDEIVMVFVSFPSTTARRPLKELKGFARVHLEAGEEKQITIPVRLADLDYFQMDSPTARTGKWVVESGEVKIMVGGSSTSLPLTETVMVKGYESPTSK